MTRLAVDMDKPRTFIVLLVRVCPYELITISLGIGTLRTWEFFMDWLTFLCCIWFRTGLDLGLGLGLVNYEDSGSHDGRCRILKEWCYRTMCWINAGKFSQKNLTWSHIDIEVGYQLNWFLVILYFCLKFLNVNFIIWRIKVYFPILPCYDSVGVGACVIFGDWMRGVSERQVPLIPGNMMRYSIIV